MGQLEDYRGEQGKQRRGDGDKGAIRGSTMNVAAGRQGVEREKGAGAAAVGNNDDSWKMGAATGCGAVMVMLPTKKEARR
ncbi:hypothetical protein BHM03_00024220 [Ensete ventricosum]|nr:hypothetical protein BHM03_00024220 [Ensete ventricosum]